MGTVTDLNAVAAKFTQQVQVADSIRFSGGGPLGYETKVLGALFNPANKGKVCPEGIPGQMGVYAIRVENTFTGAVENANRNAEFFVADKGWFLHAAPQKHQVTQEHCCSNSGYP